MLSRKIGKRNRKSIYYLTITFSRLQGKELANNVIKEQTSPRKANTVHNKIQYKGRDNNVKISNACLKKKEPRIRNKYNITVKTTET